MFIENSWHILCAVVHSNSGCRIRNLRRKLLASAACLPSGSEIA